MSGLYIHVPFCHAKCAYCGFYSSPDTSLTERYALALVKEWHLRRHEIKSEFTTIYIGGGTPSILSEDSLSIILDGIPKDGEFREFTIEANPEDITPGKVEMWLSAGINRVSMGVQSLDDSLLVAIGRRHSAADAVNAATMLRSIGVNNLSLDLIYGIPGQTLDSWTRTLDTILSLHPEHLSAYSLTYEPHTRLSALRDRGRITPVDDDTVADMYLTLIAKAAEAGYNHYEISNFALPGHEAIHNSGYWDSTPYLGLGPAAHSFDGKIRRVNPGNTRQWLASIESGAEAYEIDDESPTDRINDIIITSLRTSHGLDIAKLPLKSRHRFLLDAFHHIKKGNLVPKDTFLVIPEDKWLVSDSILSDLIQLK